MSSSISVKVKGKENAHSNPSLQERLDVDLQGADRVLEFVLLQHGGVQDTEGTDDKILAADANVDRSSVTGEVSGIWELLVKCI